MTIGPHPESTLEPIFEKAAFKELLKRINRMTNPYRLTTIITQAEARLAQVDPDFTSKAPRG